MIDTANNGVKSFGEEKLQLVAELAKPYNYLKSQAGVQRVAYKYR